MRTRYTPEEDVKECYIGKVYMDGTSQAFSVAQRSSWCQGRRAQRVVGRHGVAAVAKYQ